MERDTVTIDGKVWATTAVIAARAGVSSGYMSKLIRVRFKRTTLQDSRAHFYPLREVLDWYNSTVSKGLSRGDVDGGECVINKKKYRTAKLLGQKYGLSEARIRNLCKQSGVPSFKSIGVLFFEVESAIPAIESEKERKKVWETALFPKQELEPKPNRWRLGPGKWLITDEPLIPKTVEEVS